MRERLRSKGDELRGDSPLFLVIASHSQIAWIWRAFFVVGEAVSFPYRKLQKTFSAQSDLPVRTINAQLAGDQA